MVEQERLDRPMRHSSPNCTGAWRRPAPQVRFEQGSHPLLYWPGLVVFAGGVARAGLACVRALQAHA